MNIKQNIQPLRDVQEQFYDTRDPWYLKYKKNSPYASYIVHELLRALRTKTVGHVFELGAGQGRFTFALARYAATITAVDISKKEIGMLNQHAHKMKVNNVTGTVEDILALPEHYNGKPFDVVLGFFILHHLPKKELPRLARVISGMLGVGGEVGFVENIPLCPFHLLAILIRNDMTWNIERGTYSNYINVFLRGAGDAGLEINLLKPAGFLPPEIINRWPALVFVNRIVEVLPFIKCVLCPYIIIGLRKGMG